MSIFNLFDSLDKKQKDISDYLDKKTKTVLTENKKNDDTGTVEPLQNVELQISDDSYDLNEDKDYSEILIEKIQNTKLNIIRNIFEVYGESFGDDEANIEIKNYLVDNPLQIAGGDGSITEFPIDRNGKIVDISNYDPSDVTEVGLSKDGISFIAREETSHTFGYTMSAKDLNGYDLGDAGGHRTYGYGLLTHPNGKYMDQVKSTWSQNELEQIYMNSINKKFNKIKKWEAANNIQLRQNQIDAIASAMFNFGDGFLNFAIGKEIAKNPDNANIPNMWAHLSDKQGQKYPGLIKRRMKEAQIYSMS